MAISERVRQERQRRHDAEMAAAATTVPHGPYCYDHTGRMRTATMDGVAIEMPETRPCPYWKRNGSKPDQRSGYCRLLKAGDWMPHPRGTMLLWDQVKECSINLGTDDAPE